MTYIEAVTDIEGQNDVYQSRDGYRRLGDVGFIFVKQNFFDPTKCLSCGQKTKREQKIS
jgi:hypothetical protein